jgi:hypothetical protein
MNVEFASRVKVKELLQKHDFGSIGPGDEWLVSDVLSIINEFNAWASTVKLVKKEE